MDITYICLTLVLSTQFYKVAGVCKTTVECLYSAWYFWFIVFWVLFFIGLAIIFCIKKKNQRVNTIHVAPKLSRAISPPPYEAPSHKPPPYTIQAPMGTIPSSTHGYQPYNAMCGAAAPASYGDLAYPPETPRSPPPPIDATPRRY